MQQTTPPKIKSAINKQCFHCGEDCKGIDIYKEEKAFCCEGCKQVYLLLSENDLCVYYDFDKNPGLKVKGKFASDRFAYLDDAQLIKKLAQFQSDTQINVTFYLPQIHCSSCIYLLENLHRINEGVTKSQTNFQRKEIFVAFNPHKISLRKLVELLAFIGYEPTISLNDVETKKASTFNRSRIYKIGVAGFCFANIMMLSFPEYFSAGNIEQVGLKETFTWLSLGLSLPVLFYSASGFFTSAFKALRQNFLNIDAPIALAILVTYIRSYYEIVSGNGAGYLDSGTGIVFFMLIGRWFQDKTYDSFSFERDYLSYFPLGVSIIKQGVEKNCPVTYVQKGNRIIIRNEETIPTDCFLISGNAHIDYSFVSGENVPVQKNIGELIYAGGKQIGTAIELEVIAEVSQSYITQLWNNNIFAKKKNEEKSFIHPWSRYFTLALFAVAITTLIYWTFVDTTKILPAVSAVLIVACPCSLLLSTTFAYGNMLRIFGKNKLYLKNASVIEALAKIQMVVFDKTGTITQNSASTINYEGTPLTTAEKSAVKALATQSSHPLSKIIAAYLGKDNDQKNTIENFKEFSGKGLEGTVHGIQVKMGSIEFIKENNKQLISFDSAGSQVQIVINGVHLGKFNISNVYREGVAELVKTLKEQQLSLAVLTGDNDSENDNLKKLFGANVEMRFNQSPQSKFDFIKHCQQSNTNVLMLGDGLNDAGALMQSNVGIAVSDNTAQFSPACDAILDGNNVKLMAKFIAYAKSGKTIITASFILSILYNIVGLSFAVQGVLSPMIAAILMPISSISIVLLVTLLSSLSAKAKGLK